MMSGRAAPLQRVLWLVPLVFFEFYLALTVWLFFYGPWPWDVDNSALLFAYLAAAQVAISLGYLLSWRRLRAVRIVQKDIDRQVKQGVALLKKALLITALLALPTSMSRTGNWIPDVVSGLANTGLAYNQNFERLSTGNAFVAVEYLRMLMAPWLIAVFPLTVLYWTCLSWRWRFTALSLILFNLATYVSTGVNKGIADIVVTLPWFVLLAVSTGLLRIPRFGLKLSMISMLLFAGFVYFFGIGQLGREGSGTDDSTFFTGITLLQANSDHFISVLIPVEFRAVFEALSRYVMHGYYALSLALHQDSPSTLGFGHSMFLARNADAAFGTNFFVWQSLPGVLERKQGWGMFLLWHSIYPWLASDVGFMGALLVIGGLAYLLGLAWGRALSSASALWSVLLFLLLVVFYYVPANNQVFQSGETCVGFFLVLWMIFRQPRKKSVSIAAASAKAAY